MYVATCMQPLRSTAQPPAYVLEFCAAISVTTLTQAKRNYVALAHCPHAHAHAPGDSTTNSRKLASVTSVAAMRTRCDPRNRNALRKFQHGQRASGFANGTHRTQAQPCRSWGALCLQGRGRDLAHAVCDARTGSIPAPDGTKHAAGLDIMTSSTASTAPGTHGYIRISACVPDARADGGQSATPSTQLLRAPARLCSLARSSRPPQKRIEVRGATGTRKQQLVVVS